MRAMKKILILAIVSVFLVGLIGNVSAQFSRPEDAISYRKSVMLIIGHHFGRLGDMLKGVTPYEQDGFANNASLIQQLSALPWEAFLTAGSDKGNTTMKASVLKNPEKFKKISQNFEEETARLVDVAKGNDVDAVKRQFGKVAKSCKECHRHSRK